MGVLSELITVESTCGASIHGCVWEEGRGECACMHVYMYTLNDL